MAYIGYSEFTNPFTKLLVDEFGSDYNGDSYLVYMDKIHKYLNEEIDEKYFLRFLDESKFCVFELDDLLKEIDCIIKNNISYKQKISKLIENNIDSESCTNRSISIKGISLLFDNFTEVYNDNIFDYEGFYIPVFGIFVNFSQEKFMEFINNVIKYNSLTFEDFYFLLNFLRDIVDFKHLNNYTKEFILYCEDYLDVEDDSSEHISILMFLTFKLSKTLPEIINSTDNDFWMKDKNFIISTLKLFSNYCKEYNSVFIEHINDKNEKFIENRDVIYGLLKHLTGVPINDMDCEVILNIYSRLVFDYVDYSSIDKITSVVKYLVTPIFKFEHMEEILLLNNVDRIINILSFCFVSKINYVDMFKRRYEEYGFDTEICSYVLKLILSEDLKSKKDYITQLMNIPGITLSLKTGNDLIYTYLVWISNDLLNDKDMSYELSMIMEILRADIDSNKFLQMYYLIKNIIQNIGSLDTYIFEGESFYKTIMEKEKEVHNDSLISEYFYARDIFLQHRTKEIEYEKTEFLDRIRNYFSNPTSINRSIYYEYLLNSEYFDIYKFDLLDELSGVYISEEMLKNECDFLIYDSPHIKGLKFGLLLSINVEDNRYFEVYRNTIFKMTCGDIFRELNCKFKFIDEEFVLSSHKSYVFVIKWYVNREKELLETSNIRNTIFKCINSYDKRLDSYCFIYIIVFTDHSDSKDVYNGINITTIKLRTIIELINLDVKGEVLKDEYIYLVFDKCLKNYVRSFVSFTQFEVLEEIYNSLERKFIKFDKNIKYKEIENNQHILRFTNVICFESKYKEVLSYINKVLKSSEANEYYENIFINQDLNILLSILNNEKRFYNPIVELFHTYVSTLDFKALNEIHLKSDKNMFIAKMFIRLLAEYPKVIRDTIQDIKKLELYIEILNNAT